MNTLNNHFNKKNYLLISILALLLLSKVTFSYGYSFSDSLEIKKKRSYLGSYFSDAGKLYSAPFHWTGKDWFKAGVVAGTGLGIYALDDDIQQWSVSDRTKASQDISSVAEKFGNTSSTTIALGVTLVSGLIIKNQKMQDISLLALKSSLLSGLLAQTIKNIGHRSRPNSGNSKNSWYGPAIGGKHKAFPSGHTATAFALATTLSQVYKDKKWIAITSYSLATVAGFSRIHDNKHWATDVFAGAVLGYFTSKTILKNEKKNGREISFQPSIQFTNPALTVLVSLN
ncbi:phosphatase PAP2 family protein [Reichenbachiella sp. MALMAid0571]|uniref:phosphatase PAP2 family protein n=1 Tax=Reichenbachiella sp. MALMAid0571 TaxID=3143939 RepID=UPI0032DE7A9F